MEMDKNAPLHMRPNRNDKNSLPSSSSKTHLFSSLSPRSSSSFLLLQIVLFLHFILVRPLPFFLQHWFMFKNAKPHCPHLEGKPQKPKTQHWFRFENVYWHLNKRLIWNILQWGQVSFIAHISRDASTLSLFTSEADDYLHSNDSGESRQEVLEMSRLANKFYEFFVFIVL